MISRCRRFLVDYIRVDRLRTYTVNFLNSTSRRCCDRFVRTNKAFSIRGTDFNYEPNFTNLSAGPSGLTCVTVNGLHMSGSGCAPPRNTIPRLPSSRSMNTSMILCFTCWSANENRTYEYRPFRSIKHFHIIIIIIIIIVWSTNQHDSIASISGITEVNAVMSKCLFYCRAG